MAKLWTKDEEREQLRKIQALIEETEYGSYIRMAFCGCVTLAEENIEYDMGNSYPEMLDHKDKQIAECGEKLLRVEHERDALQKNLDEAEDQIAVLRRDCENWEQNSHEAGDLYCELEKECAEKDMEIIRLKAEIYDLRKERE